MAHLPKRRNFPWRTVFTGLALQVCLAALLIPETPVSAGLYNFADGIANRILEFAGEGTRLVFGPLADSQVLGKAFGEQNGFILAITIGGTIILVAVLSSLLYHLRILQKIVRAMAWAMRRLLRTSGVKASLRSKRLHGSDRGSLVIQPYLKGMTRSEILTMMVGGMATIAGGVLPSMQAWAYKQDTF